MRSIHLDHSGIEIRASGYFAWMVANTANSNYVHKADQQCHQAPETHYLSWSCHKFLKLVMAVVEIIVTV